MSNFVLDASVALQWLLEDEPGREYSLDILPRFAEQRAVVPILWCYEVANGLLVAHRRKRITFEQLRAFLERLRTFLSTSFRRRKLKSSGCRISPCLHDLTNYDATYLAFAVHFNLPLATADAALRRAAGRAGVPILGLPSVGG